MGSDQTITAAVPRNKLFGVFPTIRLVLGALSLIMIWAAAYNCIFQSRLLLKGAMYVILGIVVFLMEERKLIEFCCGLQGFLCKLIDPVAELIDGIARGLFYALISIIILVKQFLGMGAFCLPTGILLAVTAFFYIIQPCETVNKKVHVSKNVTLKQTDPA